jgi:hypothetical protein
MIFKDAKAYGRFCDAYQRVGKPSRQNELPLHPVRALQAFEKWVADFIGPINPTTKHSKDRYIIIVNDFHIGLSQQLFNIVRPILLLVSFLKILSHSLDVLGV